MDRSEKFDETFLPDWEYCDLNMEDITYDDDTHAKNIWKSFETKNLGQYNDL